MSKGFGLDFVQTPEIVRRYSFRVLPLTLVDGSSGVQRFRIVAADTSSADRFFVIKIFAVRSTAGTANAIGLAVGAASSWGLNTMSSFFVSGHTNNPGNNAAALAYEKGLLPFVDIPLSYAFTGGVDIDMFLNISNSAYTSSFLASNVQWECLIALIV